MPASITATADPREGTLHGAQPGATSPRRIAALDVLRGIAILGTLATNIGIFVSAGGNRPGLDNAVATFVGLITDGKYIGLLTIMFGIGLEIQRQSAVRRGDPWLGSYPWRAAILILDGVLNYIFIFEFDVLMGYGLTGLVMCVVLATTPRVQKWVMGIGVSVHLAYLAYLSWPSWFAGNEGAPAAELDPELFAKDPASLTAAQLQKVAAASGVTPQDYVASWSQAQEAGGGTSSYWDQVQDRLASFWGGRAEIPIMLTMGMGLFLIGAFLYRAGIFEERGARLRKRVMLLAFGVGLPLDWLTRLFTPDHTAIFNRYLTSACVSFGILALVGHFYATGRRPGRVGRAISNVGRMALTCYIAQNLIASILFYDWGLGLANRMAWGIWAEILAWAVVSGILLVFSALWLRSFQRGPIEWLWHVMHTWLVANTTNRWR